MEEREGGRGRNEAEKERERAGSESERTDGRACSRDEEFSSTSQKTRPLDLNPTSTTHPPSNQAAPLNFVPVDTNAAGGGDGSGFPFLMPAQQQFRQFRQHGAGFPLGAGDLRPGVAASAPGRFGHLGAGAAAPSLPPAVACSPGSELSTAFTLACDIFDEIDERAAAAAAAAAPGRAGAGHFSFGRVPSAAAARPPLAPPPLAGIREEASAAAAAAAGAMIAHDDGEEKLRGLDFDDDGCFDDDGGDDDEMLLTALEGVPRPISSHHRHTHHNPFASSSYTPGSAGPLADSYGSTGDELAGFGANARASGSGGDHSHSFNPRPHSFHHHDGGPPSLASSSYGGLGASGAHFAALSPSVGAHHPHHHQYQHSAAAAALRRVQSAAAMNGNGGGAVPFGDSPCGGIGGIGSSLAAAAAAAAANARPRSGTAIGGGYAALAAAGGLSGHAPPLTAAAAATSSGGARLLSSSAPRSGARGPRHGMGFGGGSLGGRNPLSVSSSPSLKALSSSLGRGGASGTGDASASSSFNENNGNGSSRDGTPSYGGAQPSRSGRIPRPPRRPLDGYSDDEAGGAGSGFGSFGSFGAAGRKVHNPWSVEETEALVRGVEARGGGRWADIKKLGLPELEGRSAVDLKDKWRNLARLVALPGATPRSVAVSSSGCAPGAGGGGAGGGADGGGGERRKLPAELLERVRLLLPTSPAMPYGRITPSRAPGARARKRR